MISAPELLVRRREAVLILPLAVLVLAAYAPAFRRVSYAAAGSPNVEDTGGHRLCNCYPHAWGGYMRACRLGPAGGAAGADNAGPAHWNAPAESILLHYAEADRSEEGYETTGR